ncbi:hypothetical protein Vretimale_7123 [Volvox reticuliferus]|uniref:Mitochondrial carrier protein n=1 Tax=Volvox reticuliferus TaxID=1737510 RepID=A0A8J4CGN5_9CHLO|nr:hypothetical protein Vretifemale_11053 [Volvox reticuliferus]GIM02202.1 hypothetical protein Vretimale_7123 [Volvox reticuliferus]
MSSAGVARHGDDPVKAWIQSNVPHVVRELVAGGAAGAVAKTCVAPLERTKILLMTGRSTASAFTTLSLIVTSEGIRGLFRGNGASCLRIMPYAAIHFSVYESYRRLLAAHFFPPHPQPQQTPAAAAATSTAIPADGATSISVRSGGGATGELTAAAAAGLASASDGGGGDGARAAGGFPVVRPDKPPPRSPSAPLAAAAGQLPLHHHLGEDVPPAPMTSSIDVSATAVITTVEEEQREEEPEAAARPPLAAPAAQPHRHPDDVAAQRRRRPGPLIDLVAGSAAGATAVLLTYPLDMVRTRLAWAMNSAPGKVAAVQPPPPQHAVLSGPGSATTTTAAAAAAAVRPSAHHTRIGAMLVHTARHEGMLGLYRGLTPTLYGIMPYAGLKFFVYGSLKQWYRDTVQPHPPAGTAVTMTGGKSGGSGGGERLPVPYMLAFGGASGLLAQTVTYPLDVIRRRMQVFGLQQTAGGPTGLTATSATSASSTSMSMSMTAPVQHERLTTWAVGSAIVRKEGLRGLFRGLSLNYVKVVPSTAIGFTVYDILKSYLGVTGNM